MYAAAIEFKLPRETDWEATCQMAQDRAHTYYQNIPGLRSKAFVVDPERQAYGGQPATAADAIRRPRS